MSWRHLNALWRAQITPAGLKLLLATLADRADDSGGGIRYAVETMAARCSLSDRQVKRYLADALSRGLLVIERKAAQHKPAHYRVPLQALEALARGDADVTSEDESRGDADVTPEIQTGHPRSPGVTSMTARGDIHVTQSFPESPEGDSGGRGVAATPDAAGAAPAAAPGPATQAVPAPCVEVAAAWQRLQQARPDLDYTGIAEAARVLYIEAGIAPSALDLALDRLRVARQFRHLPTPPRNAPRVRKPADPVGAAGKPATGRTESSNGQGSGKARKSPAGGSGGSAPTPEQCRSIRVRARGLCLAATTKKAANRALLGLFGGNADRGNEWLAAGDALMEADLYSRALAVVEKLERAAKR